MKYQYDLGTGEKIQSHAELSSIKVVYSLSIHPSVCPFSQPSLPKPALTKPTPSPFGAEVPKDVLSKVE